ncbi:hypothetical protein BTA51_05395 [Hahella sp. CCB-MM4]|uniref:LysR family transcriptional regulator n=1 Tax=Hahella sp. (strain CCB-MM4) TaxID=1926491 RepID=UPI000B9BCE05|nr:LysR family transcriptional regulator [Hahella sp. CCB-MM4]OZG74444.1 hypothetical protein BTA51_05395 [Hahella sp. CCB-MM4]
MAKFNQYKVFTTVIEEGSASTAAQLLNISPSAVSKQIAALENHLNVQLFERSNRNIKPTEYGLAFYRHCKQILMEVSRAEDSLRETLDALSGTISLTLSKSLIRSGIFEYLGEFTANYPEIRFDISLSEKFEDLQENAIDFAFRIGQLEDHSRLIAIPLRKVRPIFCATPDYLTKHGHPQSYTDLHHHNLALLPANYLSYQVRQFLKQQQVNLYSIQHHRVDDIEAGYQMINADMCIGLMLDCTVERQLSEGSLIEIFPSIRLPEKTLYLMLKKSEFQLQRCVLFKEFIKGCFRESR